MKLQYFGLSERAERDSNDDSFAAEGSPAVFAVADGVGSRPGGREASRAAVEALVRRLTELGPAERLSEEGLRAAVAAVNEDVMAEGRKTPRLEGLGTTLSGVVFEGGDARVIHVGDSRVYLLRGGALTCLTRLVQQDGKAFEKDVRIPVAETQISDKLFEIQ